VGRVFRYFFDMGSPLIRKLLFLSSWAIGLGIGMLVLCMALFCHRAQGLYDDLLGGKPLPVLTEFYLFVHGVHGGYLFVVLLLLVATVAFLPHFAATRSRDPLVAIWIWILLGTLTAFGTIFYLGVGVIALLLPLISTCCGMVSEPPGSPNEEFLQACLFVGALLGAMLYLAVLAVLMWRRRPRWEANLPGESGR